jgi:hypothetical protein
VRVALFSDDQLYDHLALKGGNALRLNGGDAERAVIGRTNEGTARLRGEEGNGLGKGMPGSPLRRAPSHLTATPRLIAARGFWASLRLGRYPGVASVLDPLRRSARERPPTASSRGRPRTARVRSAPSQRRAV